MAIGKSGKIVVEMEVELKRELHAALQRDGFTLKEWLVASARRYLATRNQPEFNFDKPQRSVPPVESR